MERDVEQSGAFEPVWRSGSGEEAVQARLADVGAVLEAHEGDGGIEAHAAGPAAGETRADLLREEQLQEAREAAARAEAGDPPAPAAAGQPKARRQAANPFGAPAWGVGKGW